MAYLTNNDIINKQNKNLKIEFKAAEIKKRSKNSKRQWWNIHWAIYEIHSCSSKILTLCVLLIHTLQTHLQYE